MEAIHSQTVIVGIPFGNDQVRIYLKILSFNILKPTYNDGDNVTKIFSRYIHNGFSLLNYSSSSLLHPLVPLFDDF